VVVERAHRLPQVETLGWKATYDGAPTQPAALCVRPGRRAAPWRRRAQGMYPPPALRGTRLKAAEPSNPRPSALERTLPRGCLAKAYCSYYSVGRGASRALSALCPCAQAAQPHGQSSDLRTAQGFRRRTAPAASPRLGGWGRPGRRVAGWVGEWPGVLCLPLSHPVKERGGGWLSTTPEGGKGPGSRISCATTTRAELLQARPRIDPPFGHFLSLEAFSM
jgi:hypothetical protein